MGPKSWQKSQRYSHSPLLGVTQKPQAKQPQHVRRGSSADSCRLWGCGFSICEPCLIDSVGCVLLVSWIPLVPTILRPFSCMVALSNVCLWISAFDWLFKSVWTVRWFVREVDLLHCYPATGKYSKMKSSKNVIVVDTKIIFHRKYLMYIKLINIDL